MAYRRMRVEFREKRLEMKTKLRDWNDLATSSSEREGESLRGSGL